ncbi:hypothetical protein [Roseateles koreensis]|uniref:Uncharacterized protein n=1 Tax=Roseateles koreensis TaxID=2987526 RepID=A0ABT5KVA4_9BURK|nr:hypothetical protein [Roseateles koreensis]MDC8786721.1 hypothetical protein [Roseateles koreensis]
MLKAFGLESRNAEVVTHHKCRETSSAALKIEAAALLEQLPDSQEILVNVYRSIPR